MKKKLLITASTFPRWSGDTEPRFILDYAKAMRTYYDVTVLVPSAPGAKEQEVIEGVDVIRYRYFPIKQWETLCYPGAIVPRIKEKKRRVLLVPWLLGALYVKLLVLHKSYDLIHAHWLIPQGIVQSFINAPYIVTGHGGDVTSLNKGIFRILKRRCLKRAKCITTVSSALKNSIENTYGIKQISVISMGCDTSNFSRSHRKSNFFNQNEKLVVLFVGRLAEKKGVTYLIDAMEKISAKLVIVGSGPLEEKLKLQASKKKCDIEFWGAKTHQELYEIYASADIFVAPSVTAKDGDQEGIPTAIMEAMASGLPIISTKSGGIVEIIEDGKNGILVDEKDVGALSQKIQLLIDNPDKREMLARQAEKTAKLYDYSEIAKRYKEILTEL